MELFHNPSVALPYLLVLAIAIILEAVIYTRQHDHYPWREGLASLALAAGHSLSGVVSHTLITTGLALLVWRYRVADFDMTNPWNVALLFVLMEFAYYWYHRSAHRVRLLWASHSVHHSPEEMTLTAAGRLAWTPILSGSWAFFLPLVWLGFDPLWVFGMVSASLLYQFWLHTTLIPRLGPLEYVLNTPSAHRVHHASNPEYLDRNYGGVLIVFDRWFGTYVAEDAAVQVRFGLVHQLRSLNPLTIAYHELVAMVRDLRHAPGWRARLRVLFAPPGGRPAAEATGHSPQRAMIAKTVARGLFCLALLPMLGGCVGLAVRGVKGVDTEVTISSNMDAAKAGDAKAQFAVGSAECCAVGRVDAVHDNAKAAEWLCKAARQDYAPAQYRLGRMYAGRPVFGLDPQQSAKLLLLDFPHQYAVADVWLTRAARDGDADAKAALAEVAAKLSAAEQSQARNWLADWMHAPCEWADVMPKA